MFVVNDDYSVFCTRGDICEIPVSHSFKSGDVVRFKATRKKDCNTVVIQRDYVVESATDKITISLTGEDTKIGEVISKPTDYWYEVELNPETNPETIIGYDEDGAKIFRLFPEGKDVDADDIEVVGTKTLQELVDYALAQAKESGEFDGEPAPQESVLFIEQNLDEAKKATARANIDAADIAELYGFVPVEFEDGNLASSNGGLNPAPNHDRLRSTYIDIGPILYVASLDTNFVFYVYAFDSTHTYLGVMGAWLSEIDMKNVIAKYPTVAYIRLIVKRTSNTLLTPEEVYGKIVCMRSKFVEGSIGKNPHEQYFQITWNGIISLKPEFRGEYPNSTYTNAISDNGVGHAGSRNAELPEHLVIPELVGNTFVTTIADGAFCGNKAIKAVTIPKTVTAISKACFRESFVERIEDSEHVTTIGDNAFQKSNLKRAYFPNLQTLGATAFCQCSHLTYAHIGKVTEIPNDVFFVCRYLSCIENTGTITSVGATALHSTNSLVKADFVKDLKSIGVGAFACTKLDFDWSTLTGCTFDTNATPLQYNDNDFWSGLSPDACKNPLPTHLCQIDPRWANRPIRYFGSSPFTYTSGCQLFCIIHAYCGLNQLPLSTVVEFENIINGINPNLLKNYDIGWDDIDDIANPLGMTVTKYAEFNQANLKALYKAIAGGAYAILGTSAGQVDGSMSGHVVLAYGVTPNGDLMIADSDFRYFSDKTAGGAKYTLPYQSLCLPKIGDITFCILSK